MRISVVIPTYKTPQYLDLALKSGTENQVNPNNQIIVVVDHPMNEEYYNVIKKYPGIDLLVNEENKGQTYCHNTGVMLAEHEWVLVVNDDNVFPPKWDEALTYAGEHNERCVISPNQIEPTPSIFKSFICQDYGTTVETFRYDVFNNLHRDPYIYTSKMGMWGNDGQTWPLFMSKKWYMILGGIDPAFPSPAVADWDFFLRCELAGLSCMRYFGCPFYHFGSASTKSTPEAKIRHEQKEQQSFEYFAHKWGYYPTMRADTHSKINPTLPVVRGVRFCDDGP